MGEVEEQRYVCKICSKRCVSGKSLGGHMRVHLAQIAASKKAAAAAQLKAAEIKIECVDNDDQFKESCIDQSNSEELGDGDHDQSNSYELRENPKKSWRISDPKKHPLIANSCRECGKEFASLRALSGHMRCHSIKNKKEVHLCRECGRGFDSMRAMFGHMKSHSKRAMKVNVVESAESLSDLENFCPIRRKRSRIRYKGTVNPSFSGDCGVSEIEEAARCLVMMSRGVGSFLKFDANAEDDSDDDDDDYFGGVVTSCGRKRFCGSFAADDEMKMKLKVKMEATSLSYIDDLDMKFVDGDQTEVVDDGGKKFKATTSLSYIDDFDMKFVGEDQTEVDDDDDGDEIENGMKADLDLVCDDEFLESDESCFGKKSCENGADPEMMEGFEKKAECKHGQRVLDSQNGRYKILGTSSNLHINGSLLSVDLKHDQCGGEEDWIEQETESSKGRERECPICFKVFASGQALGGHKRAHYNGVAESKNPEMLDLNFPVPGDAAGSRSGGGLGFSSWFVERSREHEAMLLTT